MDIYDLLLEEEDGAAQRKASAMAAALRRQQAAGDLGVLTGDRVLTGFGKSLQGRAEGGENDLATAARSRLTRALAQQRQAFEAGEHEKDRAARAEQGRLSRALSREIAGKKGEGKDEDKAFKDAYQLRSQFDRLPDVKAFADISTSFDKLQKSAEMPSGAGDLSMIFSFMKMNDPGVSVMEGDVANAQNAGGVPDQVRNTYNKVLSGQRLSPEQRADFIRQGQRLLGTHVARMAPIVARYREIAQERGIKPDHVALEIAQASAKAPAKTAPNGTPSNGNIDLDPNPTTEVLMTNPEGQQFSVPSSEVAEAEANGWKKVL